MQPFLHIVYFTTKLYDFIYKTNNMYIIKR
nr:MAG TPA: hypothetical protein [Caudoviricetes sp.]